jgi:hypothetical protein
MKPGLTEDRAKQGRHLMGLRVASEHRLGEDALTVDMDVEDPVGARHHLDRLDHVLPRLEHARYQTGSVRGGPSGDAVLDPDAVTFGHGARFCHSGHVGPLKPAPWARCIAARSQGELS